MKRRIPQPTRIMPLGAGLPAFGPEVPGCFPRMAPSIYCTWCGTESLERADAKVCPICDLSPATHTTP